jgi:hypothetical protein
MSIFKAAKRLATVEAQLTAAGIDPHAPDIAAAIAAKYKAQEPDADPAPAPAADPTPDPAPETVPPAKTPEEDAQEAAAQARDRKAAAYEKLAAQAKAEGLDLEALANDPEGFQAALRESQTQAAQAAVKIALRENAPENMAHTETAEASLAPWQVHAALREAGKTQEAAMYYAKNSAAINDYYESDASKA